MRKLNIAIIGLGNIGSYLFKYLKKNKKILSKKNNCEISICETRLKKRIIIFSALDNLIKGASGQAIQNMNLMYDFSETNGLK